MHNLFSTLDVPTRSLNITPRLSQRIPFQRKRGYVLVLILLVSVTFAYVKIINTCSGDISLQRQRALSTNLNQIASHYSALEIWNLSEPLFQPFPDDEYLTDKSYFKVNISRHTDLPDSFSISGSALCRQGRPRLLIIVPSVAAHSNVRMSIRHTWGSELYDASYTQHTDIRLVFFFGDQSLTKEEFQGLQNESDHFGDVVAGGFIDSYQNLSLKIATSLKWFSRFCQEVEYIAKVDQDTLVNVRQLVRLLDAVKARTRSDTFLIGHKHATDEPAVVRSGKWEVAPDAYPYDFFPRYLYGHSYVLTNPAAKKVLAALKHMRIVPNEDAFITGIMALTTKVTRLTSEAFAHLYKPQTICDVAYSRYVTSIYSINLERIWESVLSKDCNETKLS